MNNIARRIVGKYGGSMFTDFEGYRKGAEHLIYTLEGTGKKPIAVLSAPKGATDMTGDVWENRPGSFQTLMDYYDKFISEIKNPIKDRVAKAVDKEYKFMESALGDKVNEDRFRAKPEDHSGIFMTAALEEIGYNGVYLDGAQAGIVTNFNGKILEKQSMSNIHNNVNKYLRQGDKDIAIIGGFVGKLLNENKYKLMSRNSTDATGAITACSFGAVYLIIKDVPGIYRMEPEYGETEIIEKLSYDEASHIAWRGAKVVYPPAIRMAKNNQIEIIVKSLSDNETYTLIGNESMTTNDNPVAAISAGRFYILSVIDDDMGVEDGVGYLSDVSGIISDCKINILDANAPANTISLIMKESDNVVKYNGRKEPLHDIVREILNEKGYRPSEVRGDIVGGICLTGEAMKGRPGTLSRLTGILGKEGISIEANMQVFEKISGDPAITLYVDEGSLKDAVNALYNDLF